MADTAVEAAPGDENDDSWLYGDGTEQSSDKPPEEGVKVPEPEAATAAPGEEKEQDETEAANHAHFNDEHFEDVSQDEEKANGEDGDSDSDDSDDIKVTIGEIKSGPAAYGSLNIKRGVGLVAAGPAEKPRTVLTTGKVSLEDLDGPGSINGVPAMEFNIDTIEDKPWNKPGADISDYFNYGFNEVTWSAYCERQRRMRVGEAGVMLLPPSRQPDNRRPQGPPRHEDMQGPPHQHPHQHQHPHPHPHPHPHHQGPPMQNNFQARENTIQVMTAERREYRGREPALAPPGEYFPAPHDHYFPPHAHAPYPDHWGHADPPAGWAPSEIKELTPGPGPGPGSAPGPPMGPPLGPPPMGVAQPPHMAPPHMMPASPYGSPYRPHPLPPPHPHERERERERDRDRERERTHERERSERRERDRRDDEDRERDRERDRDRERSRSIKPDRIREKSYRRERSRSRSRRHKSRSRSPRPRERSPRDRSRDRSERDRSERERSRGRERSVKPKTKDKEEKEEK